MYELISDAEKSCRSPKNNVTTGLKCAPEMRPNIKIRHTSIAPVAIVLPRSATATFPPANRSAMIRIPARRGVGTRAELRMPDPSCNPYLALAVMAAAGADGIERKLLPPPPIQRNIYQMTVRERRKHKIRELPGTLREALEALRKDPVIREALGEHVYTHFLQAKQMEWDDYRVTVHQWELDRYLATY